MSWTDERIERLKVLWQTGMSATLIAQEIGGVSRNAVLGKVHRLGLSLPRAEANRRKGWNRIGDELRKPKARKTRAAAAKPPTPEPPRRRTIVSESPEEVGPPHCRPSAAAPAVPVGETGAGISLFDLTLRTCRYPVAGEGVATRFCGDRTSYAGGAWCAEHEKRVFTPAGSKQTRAEIEQRMRAVQRSKRARSAAA